MNKMTATRAGRRPTNHDVTRTASVSSASGMSADDFTGARVATEHLIEADRHIATISWPLDLTGAIDRLDVYNLALDAANIAHDVSLVTEGDWSHSSGRDAMSRLLAHIPDIDALVAANDAMATGAVASRRAAALPSRTMSQLSGSTRESPQRAIHHPLACASRSTTSAEKWCVSSSTNPKASQSGSLPSSTSANPRCR